MYDKEESGTEDVIDENKEIEAGKLKALRMKYDTLNEKYKLVLEIEDSSERGEILENVIIDCNYVLQNATEYMPEELEKNYKNLRDLVKKDIEAAYNEETEKIVTEKIKKGERLDPEEEVMFQKMEKEVEKAFEIDKKRKRK